MANPITNKVKKLKIPVIKKELDSGVVAEANNDGSIYIDSKVKENSPLAKEAIAHEMVHIDQMARGDLNYDKNKVTWKGKEYPREVMNEGSKRLPWEKEAYDKTKNMTKKTEESTKSPIKLVGSADPKKYGTMRGKPQKKGEIQLHNEHAERTNDPMKSSGKGKKVGKAFIKAVVAASNPIAQGFVLGKKLGQAGKKIGKAARTIESKAPGFVQDYFNSIRESQKGSTPTPEPQTKDKINLPDDLIQSGPRIHPSRSKKGKEYSDSPAKLEVISKLKEAYNKRYDNDHHSEKKKYDTNKSKKKIKEGIKKTVEKVKEGDYKGAGVEMIGKTGMDVLGKVSSAISGDDKSPLKIYEIGDNELTISAGVHSTNLKRDAMKRKALGEAAGKVAGGLDPFATQADKKREERKEEKEGDGKGPTMKSTPITMKAKSSPIKINVDTDSALKMKKKTPLKVEEGEEDDTTGEGTSTTAVESIKGNEADSGTFGTFTDTTTTTGTEGEDLPDYDEAWEQDLEGIRTGGGYKNKEEYVADMEGIKKGDERDKEREQAREEKKKGSINVDTESVFEADKEKKEVTEPGKYNMGYQESMDAKWGEGVRRRDKKQDGRQSTRDKNKYDRNYDKAFKKDGTRRKGKGADRAYNRIGDMSKDEYVASRTPEQANYYQALNTYGDDVTTIKEGDAQAREDAKTFKIVDGKRVEVDSAAEINLKNKTKAPFKLKGWGGYNN